MLWVGTRAALAQTLMMAPNLLGRDPEVREGIFDDLKREFRQHDHMGHGPLDIALWDLAGRKYGASVSKLLGGYRMTLMIDPACEPRTFADALRVGRACDDAGFFWLEDPFRDAGTSAFAHNKLRQMIRTPLLQTEHVRGIEPCQKKGVRNLFS